MERSVAMADGMGLLKDQEEISSLGRGRGSGLKCWSSGVVAEGVGQDGNTRVLLRRKFVQLLQNEVSYFNFKMGFLSFKIRIYMLLFTWLSYVEMKLLARLLLKLWFWICLLQRLRMFMVVSDKPQPRNKDGP